MTWNDFIYGMLMSILVFQGTGSWQVSFAAGWGLWVILMRFTELENKL